jgi:hypothetical protein
LVVWIGWLVGVVWGCLGLFGGLWVVWGCLGLFGVVWGCLGLFGVVWGCLVVWVVLGCELFGCLVVWGCLGLALRFGLGFESWASPPLGLHFAEADQHEILENFAKPFVGGAHSPKLAHALNHFVPASGHSFQLQRSIA